MVNKEYEIDGIIYEVTGLQARIVDMKSKGKSRDSLIKRTAIAKRKVGEEKPPVRPASSAAVQGMASTKKTGAEAKP